MNDLIIRPSLLRMFCFALANIIMTTQAIFVLGTGRPALLYVVPGMLFFGVGTLFSVYRLINPKPVLIIGKNGFTDQSTLIGANFVPWEQVEDIREYAIGIHSFKLRSITVKVIDIGRLECSAAAKKIMWLNKAIFGTGEINIILQETNAKFEEVLDAMHRYRAECPDSKERA